MYIDMEYGENVVRVSKTDTTLANAIRERFNPTGDVARDRIALQDILIDTKKKELTYNGSTIYNPDPIARNVRRIVKEGLLINYKAGKVLLKKPLYNFLIYACGSPAHYNIEGWAGQYPTVEALKEYVRSKECTNNIRRWEMTYKTDRILVLKRIYLELGMELETGDY